MTTTFGMAAVLLWPRQVGSPPPAPPPNPATGRLTAVTVHGSRAVVSRAVDVPAGTGTVELVVGPLPPSVDVGSVTAEGSDDLRILNTRVRARALAVDRRAETADLEAELARIDGEADRLKRESKVAEQDQNFLTKLETFTGTSLNGLAEKGRLDAEAVVALGKFVMEARSTKAKAETELQAGIKKNAEARAFAARRLAALSTAPQKTVREAVVTVRRSGPGAGTIRLDYMVDGVSWSPRYRLRGSTDDAPVKLEYLAAVRQKTGEDWTGVELTLSTAEPTVEAAPPDLLPLTMAVPADGVPRGSSSDEASRAVLAKLEEKITLKYPVETALEDVITFIRDATKGPGLPNGVQFHLDPSALQEAERTPGSPVKIDLADVPIRAGLRLALNQLDLDYRVEDGLVRIISRTSGDEEFRAGGLEGMGGMGGGMGGMGGMGFALERSRAFGSNLLNGVAAGEQTRELDMSGRALDGACAEREPPTVVFTVPGRIDVPSGDDGQLIEVARRLDLKPEYYAKAVPVLTPRVYRLAKLTNPGATVLLPGEASVYVGRDFVGRTRLPLVAAGEPFVVGFGVDPQLQVSRRLIRKEKTIQGGNQVLNYEFRLGLRNFRSVPVKVQLWDRLPKPKGETVGASLVKSSMETSPDPMYGRAAKLDNLLRWDVDLAPGTVGEKTVYVNYEFKLEFAKDLPPPKFLSGDLMEDSIGGGAMGGLGGMGGGLRSLEPLPTNRSAPGPR